MFWAPPATKPANQVASIAAPIGGLNAKDSLVAMPQTDAVVLQNWWPQPYGCTVRKGFREWATGLPREGQSLATWADTDGTQKMFVWTDDSVYNITDPGPVGAPLLTGLTNGIWEWVNLVNSAGSHLIALNGFDEGIYYGETGGSFITFGTGENGTWAGIDPKNAVCPIVHQHRLWVVEKNSSAGWFLPPDAIQGTFQRYDFGPLFSRGGFLQFLSSWTLDDGNGATDHLIAVSSRGEAVVYEGTDPESDTAWRLTGVYFIGAPVAGRRSNCKAGGDQFVLTQQGLVSMAAVLTSTRVNDMERRVITDKIQFLISDLISTYGLAFGWDLKYYPKDNMLIMNVPTVTSAENIQLAANQITGAWTEFTGMDAACWGFFGSTPMFAGYDGNVYMAWVGHSDKVKIDGTGGQAIPSSVQQGYSYLGAPATIKQIGMYRPTFVVNDVIVVKSTIRYDFSTEPLSLPTPIPRVDSSAWGSGIWNRSVWGGGDKVQKQWVQATGMGVAASLLMTMQTEGEVLWVATDYSYIDGGGIL